MDELVLSENKHANLPMLTKICIGFGFLSIVILFFEEDLMRILTPFLEPFLLLLLVITYFVLSIASIVYIPVQIKKLHFSAFLPLITNITTILLVVNLFLPLSNFRSDVGFLMRENKFEQVVNWVNKSLQDGELTVEEGKEKMVELPIQFQGLADRDRIYVTQENGVISIFFSRGGGMFEFYPGYKYRSDNRKPPNDGDIYCNRRIISHWYDCH